MTTRLLRDTLRRFGELIAVTVRPPRDGYRQPGPGHYLLGLALLPLLTLFLAYHWLGLLLDELLFRGYRRVSIDQPVFILGVPRSGTTALHHTLARDPQFTTMRTWECLFGLSVTWRLCGRAIARFDRWLGRPLGWILQRVERRLARGLQSVHPTGLDLPEEDYWTLLPVLGCFGLVAAFPDARSLWRIARFDHALPPAERERLMAFYRSCLQRHLYVHGDDRRLLTKNAAFAQAAASLLRAFPDARVICCLRDPA
ncbi:MAG: sulfotransferase, partial [Halofilum sp. (in: g-proteobacteria)]